MCVARKRMAHQYYVVASGRERAIGFVCDAQREELSSAIECDRIRQVEKLRVDRADRTGDGLGRLR